MKLAWSKLIIASVMLILSLASAESSLFYQITGAHHQDSGRILAVTEINGHKINIELAQTAQEQSYGLMNRLMLPQNWGMLFIFQDQQERFFWMKNTKIPLDILYFDGEGQLVHSVSAEPCITERCPSYPSGVPVQYVLELAKGEQERLGIKLGDQLRAVKE